MEKTKEIKRIMFDWQLLQDDNLIEKYDNIELLNDILYANDDLFFDYKNKVEAYTADASTTGKKPIMYEDPYADSPQVHCFVSGVKVKVTGKVINAYGNTWYQVTYTEAGKEKKGFMYESSLLFYNKKT